MNALLWLLGLIPKVLFYFRGEHAGRDAQRADDQKATTLETIHALESRAKTDDAVRAQSIDAQYNEVLKWSRRDSK